MTKQLSLQERPIEDSLKESDAVGAEEPSKIAVIPPASTEPVTVEKQGPSDATTMIQMIERAALNPAIDVEKMERLLAMHERLAAKDAEASFNSSMSAVQAKMKMIAKDAQGEKSMYASYPALTAALRPLYTEHGFSLSFDTGDGAPDGCVRVLCHVGHKGGHTRTYRADIPADGKGARGGDVMTKTHATGSAFTYGQRYLVMLIFNVATGIIDDDGEAAGGEGVITSKQQDELVALIEETDADVSLLCKHFKVGSITEIPSKMFGQVKNALLEKKKKIGTKK